MARNKKGRFAKPKEVERLARFGEAARKRRLGSPNDGASDSTEPEAGDQAESYQLEGRRIVNLGLLAKQLDESGCMACHTPLHLSDTEGSHRYGCAEVLLIKCRACEVMTPVHTSKRHYSPSSGKLMPIYDINTKIASAMYHTGMGPSHVGNFLAALEVPSLTERNMRIREKEVARAFQTVAQQSCHESLEEEKRLSSRKTGLVTPVDVPVSYEEALDLLEEGVEEVANEEGSPIQIAIKYDMGWQKRSSGRRYDSLSGVGSVIGNESGKVIGYGVRIKDCRLCTLHVRKGEIPPSHECHKNFDGTSKAMEGDLGKEIVMDLESKGAEVATLIMDDDSTTAAHIRNSVPHKITKLSDFMHVKKHIVGELYKLQKKNKVLSSKIIKYLSKCFSFAVRTSKDNADGVRQNLLCIVPHAFGCHDNCGAWCGYAKDPASYRHKSLPGGKDLAGDSLKRDLEHIFTRAAQNADKFAPCASTSENESFNNIVCSKAPKSRHYSSSGSLSTRVEAAVAQKNLGLSYISKVHEAANISPGQFYKRHAQRSERKRKHVKDFKSTLKYKRRRLAFGKTKSVLETAAEVREGKTYLSGVDSEATTVDDIETISPAVAAPDYHSISVDNVSMVYFDLETTSFHKTCDIVQLAACCGEETFSNYVLPNQAIDSRASEVTGISIISGELYSHGQRVESVTLSTCLINFVKWLEPFAPVILVAHNCRTFDSYRLVRSICGADMLYDFQNIVNGFADTLPLFKAVFQGLSSYKQEHLVQHVLQTDYSAHNALHDAVSLKDMMHNKTYPIEVDLLSKYSFSVKAVEQQIVRDTEQEKHLDSLQGLLSSHACGVAMTRKIAASGLGMNHLKLAFSRGGVDAVHALFSDRDENGKVRVSLSRRVADNISKILS